LALAFLFSEAALNFRAFLGAPKRKLKKRGAFPAERGAKSSCLLPFIANISPVAVAPAIAILPLFLGLSAYCRIYVPMSQLATPPPAHAHGRRDKTLLLTAFQSD